MDPSGLVRWPTKWQRAGLWAFLCVVFLFGGIVEYRSAFLRRRMTDADCYFRAAWAESKGLDIYDVTETNGWHYNYPPFLAILIRPFANPPPGADRTGMIPYPISVAAWYILGVASMAIGAHVLAASLEKTSPDPSVRAMPVGCARWWSLRMIPILVCLPSIGRTLSRGQTNLTVLMLFCGMAALLFSRRAWLPGALLGVAASIKLFPGYMILYPLWRKDWRCVGGAICGTVLCLGIIPLLADGARRAAQEDRHFVDVFLSPALAGGADASRASEILDANGTDNQAFKVILHNTLYPFPPPGGRPRQIAPWVSRTHVLLAAVCTLATLACGGFSRSGSTITELLFFGCLATIMIPISPVSHTHYYVFALPLVMAMVADGWERHAFPNVGRRCFVLFMAHLLANIIGMLPGCEILKDLGISLYGTLILWVAGLFMLRRRRSEEALIANGVNTLPDGRQ